MADYYVKSNFPIISAITKANPGQVTTDAAHGLATNDVIAISGVGGMTEANNKAYTVTVVDSTNFTIGVDTTSYTTYTGAGYVHPGADQSTYRGPWLASHAFVAGARVISNTVSSRRMHECTTGGTSGAAQPTFSTTVGNTTADNTVTWTTRDPTTWANATLTSARITVGTGDTVYVSQAHREVYISATTVPIFASGVRTSWICVNDSAEPPTTLATTAIVETISNTNIYIAPTNNESNYLYGLKFRAGTGSSTSNIVLTGAGASNDSRYEECEFELRTTSASSTIQTSNSCARVELKQCRFKFGNTSQGFSITPSGAGPSNVFIFGGNLLSGTSAITSFGRYTGVISGMDLTNVATAFNVFTAATSQTGNAIIRNCKMPSGWTGDVATTNTVPRAYRYELYNCDSADTNYRVAIRDAFGTLNQDTGIYNNAGATDGTTRLSWKIVTTAANVTGPSVGFVTPEIVRWNETTGSAITATVQILHDSATALKDNEIWLEVQYLGTSGVPLGTFLTDGASAIAAGSNQATSTAVWTAPGITNTNEQQLSVTFTPQEKGFIHARVYVAKASYTVYVDPLVTIS